MLLAPRDATVGTRIRKLRQGDKKLRPPLQRRPPLVRGAAPAAPPASLPTTPLQPADLRKASDFFLSTVTGTSRRDVLRKAKL